MKRICSLLLTLALVLGLCACGQNAETSAADAPTWQKQYDLGVRYLSEGNYQEAIIAFTAAIEIDPKRPDAYTGLADAYIAQGDIAAAIDILRQGGQMTPDATLFDRADQLERELSGQPNLPEILREDSYFYDGGYRPEEEIRPLISQAVIEAGLSGDGQQVLSAVESDSLVQQVITENKGTVWSLVDGTLVSIGGGNSISFSDGRRGSNFYMEYRPQSGSGFSVYIQWIEGNLHIQEYIFAPTEGYLFHGDGLLQSYEYSDSFGLSSADNVSFTAYQEMRHGEWCLTHQHYYEGKMNQDEEHYTYYENGLPVPYYTGEDGQLYNAMTLDKRTGKIFYSNRTVDEPRPVTYASVG